MKKLSIIAAVSGVMITMACSDIKREPGRVYAPDMGTSVAIETYTNTARLDSHGINYTKVPVPGTIKRGEVMAFQLPLDKAGDSTNYIASKAIPNPVPPLNQAQFAEAERLYLVNCGICHGSKLDGNGPLYNGGNGPYAAAPRNLLTDPVVLNMPDGQMMYSITHGKGQMGSYASQLNTKERWMVVHYIRNKQGKGGVASDAVPADSTAQPGAPAPAGGLNAGKPDSTAKAN